MLRHRGVWKQIHKTKNVKSQWHENLDSNDNFLNFFAKVILSTTIVIVIMPRTPDNPAREVTRNSNSPRSPHRTKCAIVCINANIPYATPMVLWKWCISSKGANSRINVDDRKLCALCIFVTNTSANVTYEENAVNRAIAIETIWAIPTEQIDILGHIWNTPLSSLTEVRRSIIL